jgi:hypothetical protein
MLGHIAGCIPFANLKDFALTLFRATRGNMLLKHEEIGEILDPSKVIIAALPPDMLQFCVRMQSSCVK